MKLYDFHCNACSKDFEDLVHDVSDARCPACRSADVEKQLSAFSVGKGRSAQAAPQGPCGGGSCGAGGCGLG